MKIQKNRIIFLTIIGLIVFIAVLYYRLGIGFGKATVKTVKALDEVKSELKEKNVDPIDTIIKQTDKILDSLKTNNLTDSLKQ